jgi:Beta-galactosidase
MIKRRDFLKLAARLGAASLIWAGKLTRAAGAELPAALPAPLPDHLPKSVEDIPFINGALNIPTFPGGPNNRGVITDQTLSGMTHIEIYMNWARLEPKRDQWNMEEFDDMLRLSQQHGLKILAFPNVNQTPDWLKQTGGFQPVVNMRTSETYHFPSPWAPSTYDGFDHFYSYLAAHYEGQIDILKYFIEVGLLSGVGSDFWCGDRYAKADFRQAMTARYGGLAGLNAAWGARLATADEISFPRSAKSVSERQWVDFVTWYQESQVRALRRHLTVIRKHFPKTHVDVPMGFGSDLQRDGCDRTAICAAVAAFPPTSIRSTHGSFNRDQPPRAYWFYKRMAPVCHLLNVGFGTEPPGGDLKYPEISRQYFEDASAGATLIFQYYQNFHLRPASAARPQAISDYKRILRPGRRAIVDIAVLYPTTQMMLDMTGFPVGQIAFCSQGRAHFDYDLVDENMIGWDLLRRYKVLLHTSGKIFRQSTLTGIDHWVRAGGVVITYGAPNWQSLEAQRMTAAAWMVPQNRNAAPPSMVHAAAGIQVFGLDKGMILAIPAGSIPDYLTRLVALLAALASPQGKLQALRGFKARSDGKYDTIFPDGRLTFDTATFDTSFHS